MTEDVVSVDVNVVLEKARNYRNDAFDRIEVLEAIIDKLKVERAELKEKLEKANYALEKSDAPSK